jgi:hypothetical protein
MNSEVRGSTAKAHYHKYAGVQQMLAVGFNRMIEMRSMTLTTMTVDHTNDHALSMTLTITGVDDAINYLCRSNITAVNDAADHSCWRRCLSQLSMTLSITAVDDAVYHSGRWRCLSQWSTKLSITAVDDAGFEGLPAAYGGAREEKVKPHFLLLFYFLLTW